MALKAILALCCLSLQQAIPLPAEKWEQTGPPGFSARATLESTSGEIPDPAILRLELTYPPSYKPDTDAIRSHLLAYRTIFPSFQLVKEKNKDGTIFTYTLEPLLAGELPLTFLAIPFDPLEDKGTRVELISGILTYTARLPKKPADLVAYEAPLLSIEKPLPLQVDGSLRRTLMTNTPESTALEMAAIEAHAIPWKILFAFLLAAAVAALIWRTTQRTPHILRNPLKSMKAYDLAKKLQQLFLLQETQASAQACFTALNDAVRYHIEEKYAVGAMVQTSEEFLRQVSDDQLLDDEEAGRLREFLQACDAVKFGNRVPTEEEVGSAFEAAKSMMALPQKGLL